MGKIKTQPVWFDQGTFLLNVGTDDFAQRRVQQMRCRMIVGCRTACNDVDRGMNPVAYVKYPFARSAHVCSHFVCQISSVGNFKYQAIGFHPTLVSHLPARLGIERCSIKNHESVLAGRQSIDLLIVAQNRKHLTARLVFFIP